MKNMKRMFVAAVVLMAVITAVALNSMDTLAIMAEDGYAVPADSGLSRLLSSGDGPAVSLVDVGYEDVVYSSLSGYYVGADRSSIDRSFPIYINSGAGLRFLDEETWLVSAEVDLLRTYEGLYLTDGYTYNSNLDQADAEEFILLALQNKLFMNAQAATFENRVTTHDIPSNSILAMTESAIRWYYLDTGALVYAEEESVFDAKLTIGSHTYDYASLLRALDLLEDVIHRAENNQPIEDQTQEIEEILNGGDGSHRDPTQGEVRPGEPGDATAGTLVPPAEVDPEPGEEQDPAGDGEEDPGELSPDDPSFQPGQGGSGDSHISRPSDPSHSGGAGGSGGTSQGGHGGGSPSDPDDPDDSDDGDHGGSSDPGDSSSDGSGGGGDNGSSSGSGSSGGSGGSGSGSSGGSGGGNQAGSGGSGSSNGSGSGPDGDTSGDDDGDQGDGGEGDKGDGSGGSGEENPNPNPGETLPPNPDAKPKPTIPMEYQDPVVELKDMEAWSYALGGELDINDPYGAIQKGVKVGIYRRLIGNMAPSDTVTDANGNQVNVYSAADHEGKSTIIRRTFVGSQTIAMAPILPETKIYVQFYYRYTEETDRKVNDDGTYTLTFARKTCYSDFYELETPGIEGFVQDIQAKWDTVFAGQDSAMELNNFTIANTSDYDPELTGDDLDFENFKKDSLPYIHRMEYTLTPLGDDGRPSGPPVTLSAGSSVMNKAKLPGGTVYLSSTPKLDSNTRYSVAVAAKDRWGNQLPLQIAGPGGAEDSSAWGGTIFTCKTAPTVAIVETENVTDKLTVKVTVSDPDGALARGSDGRTLPLSLTVSNAKGEASSIYGHWVAIGGRPNTDAFGSENTGTLELPEPADGKTYELTLESLAFAQLYTIKASGSYDPQPTAAGAAEAGSLPRVEDQVLGSMRSYTASLASGNVNFSSGVVNLLDTSGTIQMTMNNRTTVDILPLVDEFRFFLTEKESGKLVSTVTLKMSDLDAAGQFAYDQKTNSVVLYQGGPTEPTIRLEGAESIYEREGRNPWQAMLMKKVYDENREEDVFLPTMTLCIDIPTDTMRTSTRHVMRMESVVIKSGIEYQIPTSLTVTEFTTRKIQPKLHYNDLFIAGDVLEYLDLWIEDPDVTINEDDGLVYAYLYFLGESEEGGTGTRLQVRELHANKDPQRLRFEGLIPGANYSLRFVAKSFNDAEGFTNQKYEWTLWEHNFKGGSFLTGSLNLVGLDFHAREGMTDGQVFYRITGQELQDELAKSEEAGTINAGEWQGKGVESWANASSDRYMSPLIPIDGATIHFLHLDGYIPDTAGYSDVWFRFYQANAKTPNASGTGWKDFGWVNTAWETSWNANQYATNTRDGTIPVVAVPENARYVRIWINGREYAKQNGLTLLGYTQPKGENYFETYAQHGATIETGMYNDQSDGSLRAASGWSVLHMLPVKPGEIYTGQMNGPGYNLYSKEKGYMGRVGVSNCGLFRVPNGVYYISAAYSSPASAHYLYRLSTVSEAEGYDARVDVTVEDTQGYLNDIKTPWVVLKLYRSDSIQQPSYGEQPCELEQKVILVPKDPDVRADESLWSTYKGSWIPEESDAEGVMKLLKEKLTPDTKYRLTLSADYKGSLVVLDSIEFQTDGAYDTIRNNEEMRKILRNPYGNFLVIDDFEHYINLGNNIGIAVKGTLDFQGHVITRRADATFGNWPYFIYSNSGVIRSLVYDYPAGVSQYTNPGAVLYQNGFNGVLENVIVRTQSTVHVTSAGRSLLCYNNLGRIHNFIVKLGGDLRLHANDWALGGIFYANRGVIEDGYVYTDNTHGVLLYGNPSYNGTPYYGGLISHNYHQAVIRNVYTVYDTWYAQPETPVNYSRALVGWYDAIGEYLDSYHVGEFYVYSAYMDGGDKTYNNRVSTPVRLTIARNQDMNRNLSYFTDYKYAAHENNPRYIYQQPVKGLRDVQWQADTLGDAFDAEGCVPMGFYPRLKNLPNELQKYQEYIPLPTRSEGEVPVPVSDDWDPNRGAPKNEEGYVRFVFQNDKGYTIQNITASTGTGKNKRNTLELEVIDQRRTEDGLWEVIVHAKAIDYLSYYTITDLTYLRGTAALNSTLSYHTQNIEFWKEVADTNDWNQINTHMNWNYRVVRNIDFRNVQAPAFMTIDGSATAQGTTGFSGKIDGQMYTLSNINLANVNRPWLFYYVGNGGTVKNIVFDRLTITAAADTPSGNARTALIRELSSTALENVHIRNGRIEGVGYIGAVAAYMWSGSVVGCSAADTTITDLGSSAAVRIGGLVGHAEWYGSIRSSYVRDITITANKSPVIYQAGGIVGYSANNSVTDCYATGFITAKANWVGGIIGYQSNSNCYTQNTWADVKIDSFHAAGKVGGISGYSGGAANTNGLALGNILSVTPNDSHRAIGAANSLDILGGQAVYAYAGQTVNSEPKDDSYQVRRLFDEETLRSAGTWTEIIKLGAGWSYAPVTQAKPAFPKLLHPGTGELLWGQDDIPLPEANNYELVVDSTEYNEPNDIMTANCTLNHPGLDLTGKTEAELNAMFKVLIDGIDMSDVAFQNGDAVIHWNPGKDSTSFSVVTGKRTKALDYYRMTVTVQPGGRELNAQIFYERPFYWDIPDIEVWNSYVSPEGGHGYTNENFRITGLVDFRDQGGGTSGGTTDYRGLRLGRLEGPEGVTWETVKTGGAQGRGVGFAGLQFVARVDAQPWIECVDHTIERLYFKDITGQFNLTNFNRQRSGLILLCAGLRDLAFENITLETVQYSNSYFGFVSRAEGHMERVSVDGLTMKRTGTAMGYTDYAGGIAATLTGVMTEVNARNIEVNMPSNWLGGVVGTTGGNDGKNNYTHMLTGTFENIKILNGRTYVGGVVGTTGLININGLTLRNIEVHITDALGGSFAGVTSAYNYHQDVLVTGCKAYDDHAIGYTGDTSGLGVGGYTGRLGSRVEPLRRIRVENTTVEGGYLTGGIAADLQGTIKDAEIYNCDITSRQLDPPPGKKVNPNYTMYTGGVCGFHSQGATSVHLTNIVVRNTRITGRSGVGGIAGGGTTSSLVQMENCYVAEDVVITATGTRPESSSKPAEFTTYSGAGGLVGYTWGSFNIRDCISGAKVSAAGQGAGGLIGYVRVNDATVNYTRKMTRCISASEEIRAAGGYAGGIFGVISTPTTGMADDALTNIIVATNVVGGDGKNSLWANDISTVNLTSHDFKDVYVWDNSTVNGQLARDIEAVAAATETDPYGARPKSGMLIPAGDLYTRKFYEDHGFTGKDTWGTKTVSGAPYDYVTGRSNWYMENLEQDGNRFFPYPAIAPWSAADNRHSVSGEPGTVRPEGAARATDQTPSQVTELARWSDASLFNPGWTASEGNVVGVPLPPPGDVTPTTETVIYASGIDTLNVEAAAGTTVTLGGVSLTTDENGAASMTYNFKTDLTLNGKNYQAKDLCRNTLVNGGWWYFIDQWDDQPNSENTAPGTGVLRCGKYDFTVQETATATGFVKANGGGGLTNVIHLWGNQALTSDGTIYTLSGDSATVAGSVSGNAAKAEAQPFLSYTYGNRKTKVEVFHNYTLYGGKKLDQRLYQLENSLYTISPYKGYVYDGVLLTTAGTSDAKSNYFAVLDQEGKLTSYLAAIQCSKWAPEGIGQMSNTFNASERIVVLRYETGQVCVVDFGKNFVVYDSHPVTRQTLFAYAKDYITSIFGPSGETTVPHDPTYGDALEEAKNYRDPEEELHPGQNGISGSYESTGDSSLSSDGLGGGLGTGGDAFSMENGAGPEESGGPDSGFGGGSSVNGLGAETGEPGEAGMPGEEDSAGEEDPAGEEGQLTEDGTNQINGPGGPAGPGGLPGGAVSPEEGGPGEEGGQLPEDSSGTLLDSGSGETGTAAPGGAAPDRGKLPDTLFIQPEEGKVFQAKPSGGLETISCDSVSYDEKSGTYSLEGKTYYPDQSARPPQSLPEAVTLVSEELHTRQLMAELGPAMVAYDPITGQYSPYVTESLLGDAPRKTTDPAPGKTLGGLDEEGAAPEDAGNSDFEVGHGLGRDLTPRERNGFALLTLAAVTAFGILGVIFAREKHRRR